MTTSPMISLSYVPIKSNVLRRFGVMMIILNLTVVCLHAQTKTSAVALVGKWNFDDNAGNIAHDSSGNNNDGTIFGEATWSAGIKGSGLKMAKDKHTMIVIPKDLILNPAHITVELWFYTDEKQDNVQLLNKVMPNGQQGYRLMIVRGNQICWQIPDGNTPYSCALTSRRGFALGEWIYVAATYDGETMRLFVNGEEVGKLKRDGNIIESDSTLNIGSFRKDADFETAFTGIMDEVSIYTEALSDVDIESHWKQFKQSK